MIKKHLFKTVKALTAAAIVAVGAMTGAGLIGKADNSAGMVTAYAFDHQSYSDSTGYSLRLDGDVWHCYNSHNEIDYSYDGLAQNEYGWWKVNNGEVDFSFDGLAENEYGWWKVSGGAVDFSYSGMAENEYGWWYVSNGTVDFSFSGLALNQYGWWYLDGGTVDFGYSGLVQNEYGWWKVTGGAVDFGYNGLAEHNGGWFKLNNGVVDFTYYGLAENNGYWFKVSGGVVDFSYNGLAEYNGGLFKIAGGLLDNEYTGTYYNDGTYYYVDKGTVKTSAPEGTDEAEMLAINKFVFLEIFPSLVDGKTMIVAYTYNNGVVSITFKNNKFNAVSMDPWLIDTYGHDSFSTFDKMINTIASIN